MSEPLSVLYEDEWLLAVDKPAGLLMHPSWIDRHATDTLAGRVKAYLGGAKAHTLHRLDRPTSGVVVLARRDETARELADQFRQHRVAKTYWALARGFTAERFLCEKPLKEELDPIADRRARPDKPAQEAITEFERLAITELDAPVSRYPKARFSLLACTPQSGRKHQIRRHLKSLRHPIVGDTRYGDRHQNRFAGEHLPMTSLALRAMSIGFHHPHTGIYTVIYSGASTPWRLTLEALGWPATVRQADEMLTRNPASPAHSLTDAGAGRL